MAGLTPHNKNNRRRCQREMTDAGEPLSVSRSVLSRGVSTEAIFLRGVSSLETTDHRGYNTVSRGVCRRLFIIWY